MEVIWSNMATKHLESILEYVEQEFGDKTAEKTLSKIRAYRSNCRMNYGYYASMGQIAG